MYCTIIIDTVKYVSSVQRLGNSMDMVQNDQDSGGLNLSMINKQLSKDVKIHACWVGVARWWILKYDVDTSIACMGVTWRGLWLTVLCTYSTEHMLDGQLFNQAIIIQGRELERRSIHIFSDSYMSQSFAGFCREDVIWSLPEFLYRPVGWLFIQWSRQIPDSLLH